MWCRKCQQDVPALASQAGKVGCPRCGDRLRPASAAGSPSDASTAASSAPQPTDQPPLFDDWETDAQLRQIERTLGSAARGQPHEATYRREAARFDAPHNGPAAWHLPVKTQLEQAKHRKRAGDGLAGFVWPALLLGTMAFVCGGVLLGWSLVSGRTELWTIGLPIALGGQIALLIGLILQIERLWRDSRQSSDKLDTVDAQLHDLKTTTTLMGSSYGSSGTAFYTHLAHGASPEMLLTDLKSQLDLLALKMSQKQ